MTRAQSVVEETDGQKYTARIGKRQESGNRQGLRGESYLGSSGHVVGQRIFLVR